LSSRLLSRNIKVKIYKTIILPFVLYGCETWYLTLSEEHRLRVFENSFLRRIFGARREEETGEWRKSYFVLIPKYYLADQIKENVVGGACSTHGRGEECVQVFGGKARRKETTLKTKA
jgi:hypothetical protein